MGPGSLVADGGVVGPKTASPVSPLRSLNMADRRLLAPAHLRLSPPPDLAALVRGGERDPVGPRSPNQCESAGFRRCSSSSRTGVAEFESLESAHAWSARDPYVIEGVFGEVEIKPVVQVRP